MRPGDWFSAGGWCGSVRSIQHSCIPNSSTSPLSTLNNNEKSKSSKKKSKKQGGKPPISYTSSTTATTIRASVNTDISSAGPGMAVSVLITLHNEVNEPRPIGDTVRFHRDAAVTRREKKAQIVTASNAIADVTAVLPTGVVGGKSDTSTHSQAMVAHSSVRGNTTAEPALRPILPDKFLKAKDAAEYCMERSQLDVMLAAHAISPEIATRIGLENLCHMFENQKFGFKGK